MFLKQQKALLRINAIKLFICPNRQPLTLIIFVSTNTWTGTNSGKGAFLPTNKAIRTNGVIIYHFQDGKICGHTQVFNRATVRWQLGF